MFTRGERAMAFEIVKESMWRCVGLAFAVMVGPGLAAAQATTPAQQPQQPSTAQKPPQPSSGPIYYPSKGQSQEQQTKDKSECYAWATQQTGYDPVAAAQAQQANQGQQGQQKGGGAVGGAAKGAAAGAAIGAIAGDAGTGAAAGAAAGGVGGGARKKKQEAAQQQAATEQQQAQSQQLAQYQKAVGTCMEGRGYAVSK
jgi:hypothetical protein